MGETVRGERGDPFAVIVRVLRGLLVAGGVAAILPVVASLVLRQVDLTSPRLVAYVAGTPLIIPAGLAAIALFALGGSHVGTALAAVLTSILALTQAPLYLGTAAPADGATPLTIMTVNLHFGAGDPHEIIAVARAHDVDVLVTQELPLFAVAAMDEAGVDELLPYEITNGLRGPAGNGLWSRHPLTELAVPDGIENTPLAARLEVAGRELTIADVHPVSPYPDDAAQWSAELEMLTDWLGGLDGRVVVAGDFNATSDHRQFRDVLATGFQDAAAQVGAGWLPTYPANRRRIPLLITIDHVLASDGVVATDVARVDLAGTDHAALVVRLAIPPGE